MSELGSISNVSGGDESDAFRLELEAFFASLGNTGNGPSLPDGVNADNVALAVLLGAGDPPNLFSLGFSPVIGGAITSGIAGGIDRWLNMREYVKGKLINFELTDEGEDLSKIKKDIDWKKLVVEEHQVPDGINTEALIAWLGEMIDFGSLFALLPLLNDVPVIACSDIKPDEGDYRDINFDEIM